MCKNKREQILWDCEYKRETIQNSKGHRHYGRYGQGQGFADHAMFAERQWWP